MYIFQNLHVNFKHVQLMFVLYEVPTPAIIEIPFALKYQNSVFSLNSNHEALEHFFDAEHAKKLHPAVAGRNSQLHG